MKKNLLKKILLSVVGVAAISSLVACTSNNKEDKSANAAKDDNSSCRV